MNEKQKRHYRARMAVAQLFRSFLDQNGERARLLERLGTQNLPVIMPALGDTLASNIRQAADRHFSAGAEHVVVPVCLVDHILDGIKLCVLIVSTKDAKTFWQLDLNELHDSVEMVQVVEALDATKKWDVEELNSQQRQEFRELASLA